MWNWLNSAGKTRGAFEFRHSSAIIYFILIRIRCCRKVVALVFTFFICKRIHSEISHWSLSWNWLNIAGKIRAAFGFRHSSKTIFNNDVWTIFHRNRKGSLQTGDRSEKEWLCFKHDIRHPCAWILIIISAKNVVPVSNFPSAEWEMNEPEDDDYDETKAWKNSWPFLRCSGNVKNSHISNNFCKKCVKKHQDKHCIFFSSSSFNDFVRCIFLHIYLIGTSSAYRPPKLQI